MRAPTVANLNTASSRSHCGSPDLARQAPQTNSIQRLRLRTGLTSPVGCLSGIPIARESPLVRLWEVLHQEALDLLEAVVELPAGPIRDVFVPTKGGDNLVSVQVREPLNERPWTRGDTQFSTVCSGLRPRVHQVPGTVFRWRDSHRQPIWLHRQASPLRHLDKAIEPELCT